MVTIVFPLKLQMNKRGQTTNMNNDHRSESQGPGSNLPLKGSNLPLKIRIGFL